MNMNDKINPKIQAGIESLQRLVHDVNESDALVRGKLNSYLGKASWLAKEGEEIPSWAEHHILITRQLELAVKELRTLSQAKIPPHILENITTTQELLKAIKDAESENPIISLEILPALKKSQETVNEIAKHVDYGQFLKIFQAPLANKTAVDQNRLLIGEEGAEKIDKSKTEWHLNLGLLMNVYNRTENLELKKQISFLALNYLAKVAPINIREMGLDPDETSHLEDLFQLGFFESMGSYHREVSTFEKYVRKEVAAEIPLQVLQIGDFVLTDTTDVTPLLHAKFPVLKTEAAHDEQLIEEWAQDLSDTILQYFNPSTNREFTDHLFLDPPFLLDLTKFLGEFIKTGGDEEKNQIFESKKEHYETLIEQAILIAVQKIKRQRPDIIQNSEQEKQLENDLRKNIMCICITEINKVGMIITLPLFIDPKFLIDKHRSFSTDLGEFVNQTGIRLGGVRGRELVFNFIDLQSLFQQAQNQDKHIQMVEYGGLEENALYFTDPLGFIKSPIFKRFESQFDSTQFLPSAPPHAIILGNSTLQLLKGLLEEIDVQKWIKLNADPDTRQLIQTSLYCLLIQLAQANHHKDDFTKFAHAIELIHCEMVTLLALISPFNEEDFAKIYTKQLNFVPNELKDFLKVGVTKSAMNTFAGINATIKSRHPDLQRVYGEGSYFEVVGFIGSNRSTQEVLKNSDIERIDLYVGEFNHNISTDPHHNEYTPGNIQGDVEALLQAKPQTEYLTVAVDCTIDFIHSEKAQKLLQHFSQQIQEGKLNFVFFRSGQKFDMLGMDNYYGGTFFMVNNGAEQWKGFDDLTTRDSFKTDPLSLQWFCLVNKHAPQATDLYRKQIFDNTRQILNQVPESLKPGHNSDVKVSTVAEGIDPCFIDIKLIGTKVRAKDIERLLYPRFLENHAKIHFRGSFGFYHANVNFIESPDGEINVRINPGLDPSEVKIIVEFLNDLAAKVES